jgi:hypothetical protein
LARFGFASHAEIVESEAQSYRLLSCPRCGIQPAVPQNRVVERLRKICLALPEANERLSHGEPTWFAGKGKVFAMLDDHHHGAKHVSVWLPQPAGVQEMLIEADPNRFFRPPYVGPSGWVGVVLDRGPDWNVIADLVRDAYVHVATRKLLKILEEERPSPAPKTRTSAARKRRGSRPRR